MPRQHRLRRKNNSLCGSQQALADLVEVSPPFVRLRLLERFSLRAAMLVAHPLRGTPGTGGLEGAHYRLVLVVCGRVERLIELLDQVERNAPRGLRHLPGPRRRLPGAFQLLDGAAAELVVFRG